MIATTCTQNGDPSEPTDLHDDHARCKALGRVLDRIGDKWTVMVVGALSKGPVRFNALMRFVEGVSHRMLTLTLRGLEKDGLVKRTVYPTVPPKVEYQLTEVGCSLIEPLSALTAWAQTNLPAIEAARATNDDAESAETSTSTDSVSRNIAQPVRMSRVLRR